jgi:cyd operon protein YbgE
MGLGLCNVGLLMWEPTNYASLIGGFNALKVILLIWSVCTSMIVGIGFQPSKPIFRLLFNPYSSLLILLFFTGGILTAL